jgi:hypothetical protein
MKIRKEQRNDYPPTVEEIGLGKWHVRWGVQGHVEEEGDNLTAHYEYNEVTLDHQPSQEEITVITAN